MPYEKEAKELLKQKFGDKPGVYHCHVDHQPYCAHNTGGECDCEPISITVEEIKA